jgi:hypothetical protein
MAGVAMVAVAAAVGITGKMELQRVEMERSQKSESPHIERAKLHMQEMASASPATKAKLDCACSAGKACWQWVHAIPEAKRPEGWVDAVTGNTIAAKKWKGEGCVPKPCDGSWWPSQCPR